MLSRPSFFSSSDNTGKFDSIISLLWSIIKYFRGSLGLEGWSWEGSDGKRRLVLEKILSSGVFQVGFTVSTVNIITFRSRIRTAFPLVSVFGIERIGEGMILNHGLH